MFKIKANERNEGLQLQSRKSNTMLKDQKEVHPQEKNQPKSKKKNWMQNVLKDLNFFNTSSFSGPKENKVKQKKIKQKKDVLNCGQCDYKTKKEATLKNHITTNHKDHIYKEFYGKYLSFMKSLNHIAKNHHKETVEELFIKDLDEKNTENEQVDKDKEVVISESMLDDILLEWYLKGSNG